MNTARLHEAIRQAGVPIESVRVGREGDSLSVTVLPSTLQAAAQPTIDTFDWSDAAQATWEKGLQREHAKTLFTNTSAGGQVKLTKAALLLLLDEINILRAQHNLAPRTVAQVQNALLAKLDSGSAD